MNNPSPLIPQGSMLDQKNQSRARVKIAVFFVLAVHGIGLLALLMQGCRREDPGAGGGTNAEPTNVVAALPTFDATNAAAPDTNIPAGVIATNAYSAEPAPGAGVPQQPVGVATLAPAGTHEYAIAKNDTFSSLAKTYHVTTKAIQDANPGVDPTKLKIGQKIMIPSPAGTNTGAVASGADTAAGNVYTVKSGDNLSKIATHFGTTVKAIRAANNLTTDRLNVGQKLKIPVKSGGATPPPAATTDTPQAPR